jgi:hypothetical protein
VDRDHFGSFLPRKGWLLNGFTATRLNVHFEIGVTRVTGSHVCGCGHRKVARDKSKSVCCSHKSHSTPRAIPARMEVHFASRFLEDHLDSKRTSQGGAKLISELRWHEETGSKGGDWRFWLVQFRNNSSPGLCSFCIQSELQIESATIVHQSRNFHH